jgi:hypothetical protein
MVLDEYLDKSDAIVARDDWKRHLRVDKPNTIVKIEPTVDGNGVTLWQILARKGGR